MFPPLSFVLTLSLLVVPLLALNAAKLSTIRLDEEALTTSRAAAVDAPQPDDMQEHHELKLEEIGHILGASADDDAAASQVLAVEREISVRADPRT